MREGCRLQISSVTTMLDRDKCCSVPGGAGASARPVYRGGCGGVMRAWGPVPFAKAARSRETMGDTEGWHESERPTYRELAAVTAGRLLSVGRSPGAPARGRGVGRVDLGSVCRQGHQPNNRNRVTDGRGNGQEVRRLRRKSVLQVLWPLS